MLCELLSGSWENGACEYPWVALKRAALKKAAKGNAMMSLNESVCKLMGDLYVYNKANDACDVDLAKMCASFGEDFAWYPDTQACLYEPWLSLKEAAAT